MAYRNHAGSSTASTTEVQNSALAKTDRNHQFSKSLWYKMYTAKPTTGSGTIKVLFKDVVLPSSSSSSSNPGQDTNNEEEYSRWCDLPDLLLEKIFSYLSIKHRYYASLVCRNWYRAFHLPYVWHQFILEDDTLIRSKFNYYLGWQQTLDHIRTSLCLTNIGKHIKTLEIKPMLKFQNLYDFLNILSWYTEQKVRRDNVVLGIGHNIRNLKYTFPCDMEVRRLGGEMDSFEIVGTGGTLLASLRRLMGNLKQLQTLELIDLMLEPYEAQYLLDDICQHSFLTMKKIKLINPTQVQCEILHLGVFLNLLELYISPQNLGDDVLELLAYTKLEHLHIVQTSYMTIEETISLVEPKVWWKIRKIKPDLNIHVQLENKKHYWLVWQQNAPIRSILYNSSTIEIEPQYLKETVHTFSRDLRVYGQLNIPNFKMSELFEDRIDKNLFLLAKLCSSISTLVITQKICTATVLLIAHTSATLNFLHIRKEAVSLKCDWPKDDEWSDEFYSWLICCSQSYDDVEHAVSEIFGYKWKFLNDEEFTKLEIDVHHF